MCTQNQFTEPVMSLLVDTKSGAGFGTGLDVYLRTTSGRRRDGLMSSLSGWSPGCQRLHLIIRGQSRGGYRGGYRGLGKNNNKWLQQCQCYASSLSNFLFLLRINFAQFHPKMVIKYETDGRPCYENFCLCLKSIDESSEWEPPRAGY